MQGGVRKRRTRMPTMNSNGDTTLLKYAALGSTFTSTAGGLATGSRLYIPGNSVGLTNVTGPALTSYYSTGKFTPGTKIRWEPSCSFTTTGRVYVGFTDNPEAIKIIDDFRSTSAVNFANAVKGLGSMVSFPVWQETEVDFPTRLRRKMFDINTTAAVEADVLDRSCQTAFFIYIDGAPVTTPLGSFWYHDQLTVEGVQPVTT